MLRWVVHKLIIQCKLIQFHSLTAHRVTFHSATDIGDNAELQSKHKTAQFFMHRCVNSEKNEQNILNARSGALICTKVFSYKNFPLHSLSFRDSLGYEIVSNDCNIFRSRSFCLHPAEALRYTTLLVCLLTSYDARGK